MLKLKQDLTQGVVMTSANENGPIPGRTPAEGTVHTVNARGSTRGQLETDLEKFLASGGTIETVAQNVRSDPPRKPENNYGRGAI